MDTLKALMHWNELRDNEKEKLKKITKLGLRYNQLTNLPENIEKLTELTYLDLSYNKLTNLPENIEKLTELTYLDLRDNYLASMLESIGQLTNLVCLDLSDNQLTSIPDNMGQLKKLVLLSLKNNELTNLPLSLCELMQNHVIGIRLYYNRFITTSNNSYLLNITEDEQAYTYFRYTATKEPLETLTLNGKPEELNNKEYFMYNQLRDKITPSEYKKITPDHIKPIIDAINEKNTNKLEFIKNENNKETINKIINEITKKIPNKQGYLIQL